MAQISLPRDDAEAEAWLARIRWPEGPRCPHCGGGRVQSGARHPTMPYRCRDCRKRFSVRTGTVMAASRLGYQAWARALWLAASPSAVTAADLARELRCTPKAAWHLARRLHHACREKEPFWRRRLRRWSKAPRPVEIEDSTYQPTRAELEALRLPRETSPEEAARRVLMTVRNRRNRCSK